MKFSLPSFGKSSVIGLDIGASSVKVVEISQKSRDKGFELLSLGQAELPSEAIVQGAFLKGAIAPADQNLDLIIAECHQEVQEPVAVDVPRRDGNRSPQ